MKSRRRKFKKALIIENSTEVYNTNEGSLIMSTTVPETTTQHKIDENWYSYVDFLRENEEKERNKVNKNVTVTAHGSRKPGKEAGNDYFDMGEGYDYMDEENIVIEM